MRGIWQWFCCVYVVYRATQFYTNIEQVHISGTWYMLHKSTLLHHMVPGSSLVLKFLFQRDFTMKIHKLLYFHGNTEQIFCTKHTLQCCNPFNCEVPPKKGLEPIKWLRTINALNIALNILSLDKKFTVWQFWPVFVYNSCSFTHSTTQISDWVRNDIWYSFQRKIELSDSAENYTAPRKFHASRWASHFMIHPRTY